MENDDKDLMEMMFKIKRMIGPIGNHEDRGGHCGLIDFTEEIENLPENSKERKVFEGALRLCAPLLSKMPHRHIQNLSFLIHLSKTPIEAYEDAFVKALDGWVEGGLFEFGDSNNLLQKAEVLRILAEKKVLSAERIMREQAIRGEYPWLWIDAIAKYDIEVAIKEAEMCIRAGKEDKEIQALLMRLPGWFSLWGTECLAPIKELELKEENKRKIEQSFKFQTAERSKQ